ncbi:aminoglycoside phosphotransferase family protein [Paenibacillus endoradicis]|uniref:aminoglycoside phosphotransferase family protein n=1 Tax=Paenibacillus endoradicis TaxID=2972487 RepID=UPI002159641A|nr:aminoglycoside phosphotransferase family protein [Paenibacillus endoradicis]MCR8656488.1 aminoglycoside phosphotransferase family protein [Paenibacillus endoradicis]
MSDVQYNLQFEKLCNNLTLGEIIGVPEPISGGLLHRMFAIETTQGKYAIKALNPQIMLRPVAMQNYINSERISNIAANNINTLPAIKVHGTSIHELDGQFYLLFHWIGGKSLKPQEINNYHCEKIGTILAEIHMTDYSELGIHNDSLDDLQLSDWKYYLQKGQENKLEWAKNLLEIIDDLDIWNVRAVRSAQLLAKNSVISHRDLDSKNVMWDNNTPIIIDWEAAGFIHAMVEMTETAINWSKNMEGNIEKKRFTAFIRGYKHRYGALNENWNVIFDNGFLGKLGWLEYNLKRSLWIECTDETEQQLGTAQVLETINEIIGYANMIPQLEKWITKE